MVTIYRHPYHWHVNVNTLWEVIQTNFQVLQKLIKAEKLQTVSHLAASISHEVRNPLTAARGFIQLLSEDISTHSRKDYADIAITELDRATEVINEGWIVIFIASFF